VPGHEVTATVELLVDVAADAETEVCVVPSSELIVVLAEIPSPVIVEPVVNVVMSELTGTADDALTA